MKRRLHIALVYNAYTENEPELPEDRGGSKDLRSQMRHITRVLRRLGHTVTVLPLALDLFGFQRKLRRLMPDVVFNLYDDVVHGALYDMRLAALVRMMGFPMTGSPALALGLAEVDYSTMPDDIPPIMSYAAKWVETSTEYQHTRVICPANVEPELARQISAVALRAFRAVGGRGYGRVDMRLDEAGKPCVLEVNCNPCLDEGIGLARSAECAGMSYPQLLQLIVRFALERPPYDLDIPMFPSPPSDLDAKALSREAPGVSEGHGWGR